MSFELLVLFSLTLAATFFVILVSVGLVVHKAFNVRRTIQRKKLYRHYASLFAELLLEPLPPLPANAKTSAIFELYENLIRPIKQHLSELSEPERKAHRSIMRTVLIDFARDLRGDSTDRLVYFFYSFKFVEDHIKLLESRHWWIRAQAARDMGIVRARKSITALTAALEDKHPDVRNQAMRSLVAIVGVEALRTILRISRNMTRWSQIELSVLVVQFGKDAVPYLLEGLDASDKTVVFFCIEMLGEIGFVSAVDPLVRLARSTFDVALRVKVVESLGRIGDQRAEPLLKDFARNPYLPLRYKAIEAIGKLGAPHNVPFLRELFRAGDIDQMLIVGKALLRSGSTGKEVLLTLQAEVDHIVRNIVDEVLEEEQV